MEVKGKDKDKGEERWKRRWRQVEAKREIEEVEGEERGGDGCGGERSHQEMCAALHRRIYMVNKMASESREFFFHHQIEIEITCIHFSASLLF